MKNIIKLKEESPKNKWLCGYPLLFGDEGHKRGIDFLENHIKRD